MKKFTTYLLTLLLALIAVPSLAQQNIVVSDTTSYEIHFRWDRSKLDTLYLGNNHTLRAMAKQLDSLGGKNRLDSIVIVSQSSPEGPYLRNQNLSRRRAATMRSYMERRHPSVKERLTVNPDGESWEQLRHYIALDKKLSPGTKKRLYNIINDNTVPI